ncbi:allophanate hydrolase-related protein [Halomonas salifodinae]|uniref:allophanate hydrolase-related protein n=1 Tax=Halomonas salifodinae TaxID=438745 RepID=UPI0033AFF375
MRDREPRVRMFVNGQAMAGGSLAFALAEARFLGAVRTAPRYRFYSIRDEFPGLLPVNTAGAPVPGELYELTHAQLREGLLPNEPDELELTAIELEDGTGCLSMRLRDAAIDRPGVVEITRHGGWWNYLETLAMHEGKG